MHKALEKLVRAHLRDLKGYVSAGMEAGKDATKVFMNANENPFVLPGLEGLNQYPEPQPPALLKVMAETYGVRPDQLTVTRGADESLVLLTRIFCEPHQDAVIVHPPTFGMYEVDSSAMPAKVIKIPLIKSENGFSLDKEKMIVAACDPKESVKIVFICSPNNPTAGAFPKKDILEICKALEGKSIVILDEAYVEFSQQGSLTGELANYPNLIILRTLSKAYGLAGARIGATLCADTDFIAMMKTKALDAYPLPRPSIQAALHALSPEMRKLAKENNQKLLKERDRLRKHFESSSFVRKIYPSDANFLLVEMQEAKGLWTYCYERGFVLRDFSSRTGTENCLRISPSSPEKNDQFLAFFDEYTRRFCA